MNSLAFSPNGGQLASGDAAGRILLWDVASGNLSQTLLGHAGDVNAVVYSPDGRVLSGPCSRYPQGATAIYPAELVIGVVTMTEPTKVRVALGEYNRKIDERIAEIKRTCGIQ